MLPSFVSLQQIQEIHDYLRDKAVALRTGELVRREDVPRSSTIADYPLETVLRCPHFLALANASLLIQTAVRYLGCLPTISTIGIRWSFPGDPQLGVVTQDFHRDPDDWRFFKLFIYLTDVDAAAGPHTYVKFSHKTAGTILARPIAIDQIRPPENFLAITGPRGTSFIADTHGIHAGPVPSTTSRLLLEVGYSILPIYALQYKPITIEPRPDVHPYVNRLLLR